MVYDNYKDADKRRLYLREWVRNNKESKKQYQADYYQKNKRKWKERAEKKRTELALYARRRNRKKKLKAIEYLGNRCSKCGGQFHQAAYDFHHRDPSEKESDASKMLQLSWKRILVEIDKCDLLCANCHRELHFIEELELEDIEYRDNQKSHSV